MNYDWCAECENTGWVVVPTYAMDRPNDILLPLNFDEGNPLHCFPIQVRCPYCADGIMKSIEESESSSEDGV
jgi:hypothetical protein